MDVPDWPSMRAILALATLPSLACVPARMVPARVDAERSTEATHEPIGLRTPVVEPTPTAEPVPVPKLALVDEDWVWDDGDPSGPLLRIVELQSANDDDPAAVRALLGVLEPLMACYDAELGRTPELIVTLTIRRTSPTAADREGLSIDEDTREPTGIPACARPFLVRVLPGQAQDPQGRYAVRLFPHRDRAPALRLPDHDDAVIEREGGSCFTMHTHPCKPHKHCMGPTWERTRCRHPADRPGVAVRWAFGAATDGLWPRTGVDLVGIDGGLVWRAVLDPEDAARLGPLQLDEARQHLERFRSDPLPGSLSVAIEPTRVVLADRAGVRVYDRRTGKRGFRYAPPATEEPRMFFDEGTFTARKGKLRCTGKAAHGEFVARCGDALLWFDGHALAVIDYGPPMTLDGQTTLADDTSTRTGGGIRPKASLRVAGWRVVVEGIVFVQ